MRIAIPQRQAAHRGLPWQYDDGGAPAGPKGLSGRKVTGDCVTRAVAIASGLPYEQVWRSLADGTYAERRTGGRHSGHRSADDGISTRRKWFREYMASIGFEWTPTMAVGSGCTVHLAVGELPRGRLIAAVSRHYTAVIDGLVRDTYDPCREGTRCVYGFWKLEALNGSR
jgi:hypothetical protein